MNAKEESKELAPLPEMELEIEREVKQSEIQALKELKMLHSIFKCSLKQTKTNDWIDMNGKPYLQGSGAMGIASFLIGFGISWKILENPQKIPTEDGYYRFQSKVQITLDYKGMHRSIEEIGIRSAKDPFFCTRYQFDKEKGEKIPFILPASEVDEGNVAKASITNALATGIPKLLGIVNIPWEWLDESGINVSAIRSERKISYQQDTESTKDLREEIRKMILEISGGDSEKAKAKLSELTLWKGKSKQYIKDLTEAQVPVIYNKLKIEYEKWKTEKPDNDDILADIITAIQNANTTEECDSLLAEAEKNGITGEKYTLLIRERDKKVTELKKQGGK